MNLAKAMSLQIFLHRNNWLYHFDDNVRDCLGDDVSDPLCMAIQHHVNIMMNADIDWGLFDDAYGFAIALHNGELDGWVESFDGSLVYEWKTIWGIK